MNKKYDVKRKDNAQEECAPGCRQREVEARHIGLSHDFLHGSNQEALELFGNLVDVLLAQADDSPVVYDEVRKEGICFIVITVFCATLLLSLIIHTSHLVKAYNQ